MFACVHWHWFLLDDSKQRWKKNTLEIKSRCWSRHSKECDIFLYYVKFYIHKLFFCELLSIYPQCAHVPWNHQSRLFVIAGQHQPTSPDRWGHTQTLLRLKSKPNNSTYERKNFSQRIVRNVQVSHLRCAMVFMSSFTLGNRTIQTVLFFQRNREYLP